MDRERDEFEESQNHKRERPRSRKKKKILKDSTRKIDNSRKKKIF